MTDRSRPRPERSRHGGNVPGPFGNVPVHGNVPAMAQERSHHGGNVPAGGGNDLSSGTFPALFAFGNVPAYPPP